MVGHRPGHDLAAEGVDDRAAVDPAVRGAVLGTSVNHTGSGPSTVNRRWTRTSWLVVRALAT